jgi:hypothetical protein
MRKKVALSSLLLVSLAMPAFAADEGATGAKRAPVSVSDFGPSATNAQGNALITQLMQKWGNVMKVKGWSDGAMQQFRTGYRNYPVEVLQQAVEASSFRSMLATLEAFAMVGAEKSLARGFRVGDVRAEDANNMLVLDAIGASEKALGEDSRDLVFIPITPCTVWDSRFATEVASAGIIGDGQTKQFFSHYNGAGGSFEPWGGNPSCPETSQNSIGGRPFAVMMTVYINDATGNGWLTFYRAGDPDPSQATISVYYSPGPTRTQTVITKSARGYLGSFYDIAVTGRFASAHAAASVTGYFIKPQATALECTDVTEVVTIPAGARDFRFPTCTAGYALMSGGVRASGNDLQTVQASSPNSPGSNQWFTSVQNNGGVAKDFTFYSHCCRVPGR